MKKLILAAAILLWAQAAFSVQIDPADIVPINLNSPKVAHITGMIDRESASNFVLEMINTARLPGDRIIIINSPGGFVDEGKVMLDEIRREQRQGTRVVCLAVEHASSMAFNILTNCDIRLAASGAEMLVHKIAINYLLPTDGRITSKVLRRVADEMDKNEEVFRRANAAAMRLTVEYYDFFADRETRWTAETLYERGYLHGLIQPELNK
jgi:ATP-dependent protease ClpP protease subunit